MQESEYRMFLADDCSCVVNKAMETAGRLIEDACKKANDNYVMLFKDARAIVNAYCSELTFIKKGEKP